MPSLNQPDAAPAATGSDLLRSNIDQLRATAKWIIAAYAAVGAALAGGSQLSSLGAIHGQRLILAAAGALFAFVGIAVAIGAVVKVLTPEQTDLSELTPSSSVGTRVSRDPSLLLGQAPSLEDLRSDYLKALTAFAEARQLSNSNPTDTDLKQDALNNQDRLKALSHAVQYLRTLMLYDKVRYAFTGTKRWLIGAYIAVASGLLLFAYATNPPKPATGSNSKTEYITARQGPRGPRGRRGPQGTRGPRGRGGINDEP